LIYFWFTVIVIYYCKYTEFQTIKSWGRIEIPVAGNYVMASNDLAIAVLLISEQIWNKFRVRSHKIFDSRLFGALIFFRESSIATDKTCEY
jgi:hypothetical protein